MEEKPPFLMREQDGTVFIDYLDVISDDIEDPAVGLRMHKEKVEQELAKHLNDARRWEKYRWVAEYHNAYIEAEHPKASSLLVQTVDSARSYSRIDLGNTPLRPATNKRP